MLQRNSRSRAFTLVELLVTIAVIALLVAVLLPGLRSAIGSARSFKCQMSQRSAAFDFAIFADDQLHGDRGTDNGNSTFSIETFQESQYGIDEFWRWGDRNQVTLPDIDGNDPMRCPEVRDPIVLARNVPCSSGGVGPASSISFAFNLRLFRQQVMDDRGRPRAQAVRLRGSILEESMVPLLFDVDGHLAESRGLSAVYAAPSLGDQIFGNDQFWFPSARHNGSGVYAFVDGHVETTRTPLDDAAWRWDFSPRR